MWRFLNSIPRAFRNHVHSPRPSAGRYVEDDQEPTDLNEKTGCPFTGRRRNSQDAGETRCCSAKVLNSLLRKDDVHETGCSIQTSQNVNFSWEEGKERWRSCRNNFWNLFHGSHHMLEAISWGSAVLWGQDTEKRRRKRRLLYRILFAVPGNNSTIRAIKDGTNVTPLLIHDPYTLGQRAIKDAAGAAQDAAINLSKTETLDSALEEFQSMCTEYEARNESILGLEAAEHGDFATAVEHLRSSCMLGNVSACYNLGLCYETGSGVCQNADKAKHYYELAAKGGHSVALYNLGLMYMKCTESDGEGDGAAAAKCTCGCDRKEGLTLVEKAANLGLPQAQTYLGIHHIEKTQDVARAVPYFRAAADQNDTDAQYFLAICYEQGWGVEVNECRAAQLYSLAASAGHDAALYNLAIFNEHGLGGLPEDQAAAIELYQKAAELGHEQALQRLEEIRAAKAVEDQQRAKVDNFHLHQQHSKDEGSSLYHSYHHQATTLSPSASSPDLTEYLYKGLPFFFGIHSAQTGWDKGHSRPIDPGGHDHLALASRRNLVFQLGGSEESDDYEVEERSLSPTSPRSSTDESFESLSEEVISHPLGNFHRSHTYPDNMMLACSM